MLTRFGAVLGTVAVGGCLSSGSGPGSDGDPTPDGEPTTGRGSETDTGSTTGEGASALTDSSLTVTDAGCGTPGNDADVEFAAGSDSVVVTGTLRASDPCHTAELADASYDPETRALEATVAAVRSDGAGGCAECIAEIAYEATFAFDGGLPATVTVVHDATGESTTVATAES